MESKANQGRETPETSPPPVTVSIMGDSYTVRGEADPAYIAELATMVDERLRELAQPTETPANKTKLALLLAINLADELLQLKKFTNSENSEFELRARQLIELLDEGLVGDSPS